MKRIKRISNSSRKWIHIILSKRSKTVWFRYKTSNKLPRWIWYIMQYYPSLIHSSIFTFVFHSQQKLIWSCSVPLSLFHLKEWYKVPTNLSECLIKQCVTKIQGNMLVKKETESALHAVAICFYTCIQWTGEGCGSVLMVGEKSSCLANKRHHHLPNTKLSPLYRMAFCSMEQNLK